MYHTVIQTPMVVMVVELMEVVQIVVEVEEHKPQGVLKVQQLVEILVIQVQELDFKVELLVLDLDA